MTDHEADTIELRSPEATATHGELVDALGTENNPAQWMIFMRAVEKHLPVLLGAGRPSKAEIEASLIGQLGFDSWEAMVKAPKDRFGLAWTMGGYRAFRRAWAVVKQYPYLESMDVKAGWVTALEREARAAEVAFPATAEEYAAYEASRSKRQADRKAKTAKAQADRLAELEAQVADLDRQLLLARHDSDERGRQANDASAAHDAALAELRADRDGLQRQLGALDDALKRFQAWTWLDHLLAALGRKLVPRAQKAKPKSQASRRSRQDRGS